MSGLAPLRVTSTFVVLHVRIVQNNFLESRPRGTIEDMKLTEFQVELIQLAFQLNGDHILNTYPNIEKKYDSCEAHCYARDAVRRFLEAGRAGANESTIVTMRPALSSRFSQR
ncbi:putative phosphoesterase [Helianthus annuus]|nr:putative phosphoesterase [Helianthus annuus]